MIREWVMVVDWRSCRRETKMRLKGAGRMKYWVVIHVEVVQIKIEMRIRIGMCRIIGDTRVIQGVVDESTIGCVCIIWDYNI